MSTGVYSTIRPADISPEDVEIFYHFTPSRDVTGNNELIRLNPADVLIKTQNPNRGNTSINEIMGGLYTLKLPATDFGTKGIYTIVIKPIEIRTKIVDCGVLSAFPNIKGLVFDLAAIDSNFVSKFENNALVGYRIEYLSQQQSIQEKKIQNFFRIVTSNNKAEPVNQNLTNTSQKAIRYRFNDNSTLVFATVTPSSASNVKPNVFPFIGNPNQDVIITNTFFNPIAIEVEMVEHDDETLAIMLAGNQTRSLDDGVYTIYNFNNEIFRQYTLFEIKDKFTGKPLFEVREQKTNIDFTKVFNNIVG